MVWAAKSTLCYISRKIKIFSRNSEVEWKFVSSFVVFLKVNTVSEKLISESAQVSKNGMELALLAEVVAPV